MPRLLRSFITYSLGCLIFVALPLIAWGLSDISGFLDHPARLFFFLLVLVLNAFAAIRIPEIGKGRPVEKTTIRRQHLAVAFLQILSLALVLVGPFCDRRGIAVMAGVDILRYAGLCLYSCGFLLMHASEWSLGKQFTMEVSIHEGHTLLTDGPYRHIRHPRYLGIMVFSIGVALVFRSWIALICAVATALVLLWRIHDEEALLHQEFGAEWEAYVQRSWRLIPYVW